MTPARLVLVLGAASAWATAPAATAANKTNLVFLLLDDWGWGNWNLHNNISEVVTPNLDALAAGGIVLDRHYVRGAAPGYYICYAGLCGTD